MKRKLWNKIAMASVSMLACVTCIGVAVNNGAVKGVAEDAKITLPGGTKTNVNGYTLVWGSTNVVTNTELYATPVEKTNAAGQTLKGIELSSNSAYSLTRAQWYPIDGYGMSYGQYLTLKVDDTIDMSKPVEFLFAPYVSATHQSHRFVMALSDTDGQIAADTDTTDWGFNAGDNANYIYWEFARHHMWNRSNLPEGDGVGPHWYAVSSSGKTGYSKSDATATNGSKIGNTRMGGGVLARAFYGSEYLWADIDSKYTVNSQALIKAKIEFTDEQLILSFEHAYEQDITKRELNSNDGTCKIEHKLSADTNGASECWFRQSYNLDELNLSSESELNLYFGYYNVYGHLSGHDSEYGAIPMSLKLYNYNNGDVKSVTANQSSLTMKASEELNLADKVSVAYFDGATATADVTFTSSDTAIANVVDGKLVPVANTKGGDVTVTATVGDKTATFTVTVDANTVTVNGNVVAGGSTYTLEDLYEGNFVLVGYKANGNLYAVGDTIELTADIVLEEVVVDFTMLYGASIRLDDTASIRFTAILKTADLTTLETLVGAENVSYGMTLTVGEDKYGINSKDEGFNTATHETDYTLYSAVMTGIPSTDYETELTAQAYIQVKYADGEELTISSNLADKKDGDTKETNVRSLADVATAAYNDRQATKEGDYKYSDGEGKYSPYTLDQLAEIAKYITQGE